MGNDKIQRRIWREKQVAKGLCSRCGREREPERLRCCARCTAQMTAQKAERRHSEARRIDVTVDKGLAPDDPTRFERLLRAWGIKE